MLTSELRHPKTRENPPLQVPAKTDQKSLEMAAPALDLVRNPALRTGYQRLGFFLAAFLTALSLEAETAATKPTFHASLKAASEAASADHSLVLLIFGAEWCAPCKLLKKNTLAAPEFLEGAGALRIVEVDVDADEKTARSFKVIAVPTLVLLTSDGKIVSRRSGYADVKELLAWLETGRERVKQGQWEGVAAGLQLESFSAKIAADQLTQDDLKELVGLLARPDPAERNAAAKLILGRPEQALPLLIDAVGDSYLGMRIAAVELLQKLAPESPAADPWRSPAELTNAVAALKKWWADTGTLPALSPARPVDSTTAGSIKAALADLTGNDAVRRTEAMSTMAALGAAALPALREAIKRAERNGNQRPLAVLEDVRWDILVSDSLERRVDGVRQALARGTSGERQAAAARLGRGGREAIPALAELVNDADALVVESSVRALSGIGGRDAIPAMAGLLKASDSNLRMTAAQALGRTKNKEAIPPLLTAVNDPNEVVACTALSALEEVNSERVSPSGRAAPPELVAALKRCLADPRWRVRAATAEVVEKLEIRELLAALEPLLKDPDGFVAKNALVAMHTLGAPPDAASLAALARRHAGLRGDVLTMLAKSGTEEAAQAVFDLYTSGETEGRLEVLRLLGEKKVPDRGGSNSVWRPLFARATKETDVRLRRVAAESLGAQSPQLAAEWVGALLSDEDAETRAAAALTVMAILSGERLRAGSHSRDSLSELEALEFAVSSESNPKPGQTNGPPATAEQIAAWHAALKKKAGAAPDLMVAAAIYVTGPSKANLPLLEAALDRADQAALARLAQSPAPAALVPHLPWPEGRPVVDRFCARPGLFVAMVRQTDKTPPALRDYVFKPARFRAAVDPATTEELEIGLPVLLVGQDKPWSLLSAQPWAMAVAKALLTATNAGWRAAAVYALGRRDEEKDVAVFDQALTDANPWVRVAALTGLARLIKDRAALELRLGPLLADGDETVSLRAMLALLEPEVRSAAGIDFGLYYFVFKNVQAGYSSLPLSQEERPLVPLDRKPAFLDPLRRRLGKATDEDLALIALLLAQYGDFSGVDRLTQTAPASGPDAYEIMNVTLAGIALSRDAKYIPYLRKLTQQVKDEWGYRRILKALRGFRGAEARALRLEINKRMRLGNNS
jgi:HEAT repeat protein/thioredoxin-related protein